MNGGRQVTALSGFAYGKHGARKCSELFVSLPFCFFLLHPSSLVACFPLFSVSSTHGCSPVLLTTG